VAEQIHPTTKIKNKQPDQYLLFRQSLIQRDGHRRRRALRERSDRQRASVAVRQQTRLLHGVSQDK
jgi:hypothetical protein